MKRFNERSGVRLDGGLADVNVLLLRISTSVVPIVIGIAAARAVAIFECEAGCVTGRMWRHDHAPNHGSNINQIFIDEDSGVKGHGVRVFPAALGEKTVGGGDGCLRLARLAADCPPPG